MSPLWWYICHPSGEIYVIPLVICICHPSGIMNMTRPKKSLQVIRLVLL